MPLAEALRGWLAKSGGLTVEDVHVPSPLRVLRRVRRRPKLQRALRQFLGKEFDPNQPRDEDGKWSETGGGGVATAHEFVSPNRAENIQLEEAEREVVGFENRRLMTASRLIHRRLGFEATVEPAIGAWKDGAEQTVVTRLQSTDYERVRVAAAMQGLLAEQKSVLPFVQDPSGPDMLHIVTVARRPTRELHDALMKVGLEGYTIEFSGEKAHVSVFNQGGAEATWKQVADFTRTRGGRHARLQGRGEFLGSSSRGEGAAIFRQAIAAYQARVGQQRAGGGLGWFDRLHHLWRSGQTVIGKFEGLVLEVLLEQLLKDYDPNQPRARAGDPEGGQWRQ